MVDEPELQAGLDLMSQEYEEQVVTYKTFERVHAQDSIIENISLVVINEDEQNSEVYRVFDFLEKPIPEFDFTDDDGNAVNLQAFLGKYTLVALYKEPSQVRNSHIKKLNDLVETRRYNAVALIAKDGGSALARKADFPIVNECIGWYIKNLSIPETPKFLVIDEFSRLRYIFPTFPDKRSTELPLDPINAEIFELLK